MLVYGSVRSCLFCFSFFMSNFIPPERVTPSIGAATTPPDAATEAPAFSPLYQQIKQALLASLQAGEWKPLQAIPSEMELAKRYGVSQGTVRKAIDELAAENLLVRRQGKGTFVASHGERQVQYRFLRLRPDTGTLASQGRAVRNILYCKRLRAPAEMARLLGLNTGDSLLHIRRTLTMAGTPTVLEDIWLSAGKFRGLSADSLQMYDGTMYALFEKQYGVHMVRAEEKLRAVLPTPEQAQLLGVSAQTPLLQVERISFSYNNQPVEVRHALNRTDNHHYQNMLG